MKKFIQDYTCKKYQSQNSDQVIWLHSPGWRLLSSRRRSPMLEVELECPVWRAAAWGSWGKVTGQCPRVTGQCPRRRYLTRTRQDMGNAVKPARPCQGLGLVSSLSRNPYTKQCRRLTASGMPSMKTGVLPDRSFRQSSRANERQTWQHISSHKPLGLCSVSGPEPR